MATFLSCFGSLALGGLLISPMLQAAGKEMENTKEILEDSDRARGGVSKGSSWKVKLESTEDGSTSSTTYHVRTRGNNALAVVLEPVRSKDELMLFNDRTIWFFKPSLSKPVAISARQKLSGQAANGDIASTNYARDYNGKVVGSEKVGDEDCYVLELRANSDRSTYDGIKYWVSKKARQGLKAEFLNLQGEPLKIATFKYGNKITLWGKKIDFISEMTITDARNSKNFSVMTYSSPEGKVPPESIFNVNNLRR